MPRVTHRDSTVRMDSELPEHTNLYHSVTEIDTINAHHTVLILSITVP